MSIGLIFFTLADLQVQPDFELIGNLIFEKYFIQMT